jgi:hypothetical protein
MDVGLLWYDDDPRRGLEDKIGRAAQRYREKYGRWPNTCYVHPQATVDLAGSEQQVACGSNNGRAKIRVMSAPNILLHHLWLGESLKNSNKKRRRVVARHSQ